MNHFESSQKIGDIAAKFPSVVDIFKKYHIDYCCGGDRPLIKAINEEALDEERVMDEINRSYEEFKSVEGVVDWVSAPITTLVDHILNTHHAYLYETLPRLSELTTKILRAHSENHPELLDVYKLYHKLKMELDAHLIKEETIQYPSIRKYLKSNNETDLDQAIYVIKSLEEEHLGAGGVLKELRNVTKNYQAPLDGCNTYIVTYALMQELESDMFQHIHLENNILFPRLMNLRDIK